MDFKITYTTRFEKNFKTVPAGRKVSQKCGTFFSPELLNFFF